MFLWTLIHNRHFVFSLFYQFIVPDQYPNKVVEIGGVPPMISSGNVPEQLMISYISHLCTRLIVIGREARAATKIQRW